MKSHRIVPIRKAVLVLGLCGIAGMLGQNAAAQSYVFNAAGFATGHNPQSVANADLNGDTRLDVVIANFDDGAVSVLLGNPDGTYQPHVDYVTGSNPIAVVVGDFNNDNKLDLAVVNNNCPTTPCAAVGSVSILLGNGDGTLQSHIDTTVGNSPTSLVAADFSKDGKLDLIVTNSQDNTVTTFVGKGNGTFGKKKTLPTGANPHGIVAGLFVNSGNLDAVIANTGDSNITLLRGNGDGTFQPQLLFPTGPNPVAVAVTDFSSDGHLDVVTANSGSATVSVLFGADPRGFQAPAQLAVAGPANAVLVGDFNGDGKPDIAATCAGTGTVSILLGNGASGFTPHVDFATGSDPVSLTAGDLTGDGKADLAVANDLDNTITILPGVGNGTFQSRVETAAGNMPSGVATGDFNGDNKKDMAVADRSDNAVLILLGNEDGTFTPAAGAAPHTGLKPSSVIVADLNNDNRLDVVTTNAGDNTVSVLLGNGDGSFQAANSFAVGKRPASVVAGDFNRDGKVDLVVCNQNDLTVSLLLGNGNGTFQTQQLFSTGPGSSPTWLAAGDFGNSRLDLAVANANGGVIVLLGNGAGSFSPPASYAAGAGSTSVAMADFDGDGKLDLAVSNPGSNNISILLGNGNGTFQSHIDYATAKNPFFVAAGDFNGDGQMDLAVGASSTTSNRVSVLLGNGNGTFQPHLDHGTKLLQLNASEPLAIDDFNSDGSPDIAVADQLANSVSVFLNTPLPVAFPAGLNFGTLNIGVVSPPQTLNAVNSGAAPLNDLAVAVSGDYSESTACGPSLAAGANCDTFVTFTPTNGGTRSGMLSFTDNAPGPPQNVALTGVGNGAVAQLSVTSLTFGVVLIGQSSGKQTVTLTNTGNQILTISVAVTGDFLQANTCGSSVAAGASCSLNVRFKPRDSGPRTGSLTVTDNAIDSPQIVTLTGTGTAVQLVPTSLGFGNQAVGTTSDPKSITLTNVGSRTLNITGITLAGNNPGDFAISSTTCVAIVVRGGSCTINVTFTPTTTGGRKATVSIDDDGGGSPQTAALTGVGT